MTRGLLLGRLFGTEIFATPTFLLLMVLILLGNAGQTHMWAVAVWELALVLSILVHEFGHATAVRRLLGTRSIILLWGLGGLCLHEPTRVRSKRVAISLLGPGFGFLTGGLFLAIDLLVPLPSPVIAVFVEAMAVINIFYTALNLLPVLPLDGGQASLALLEMRLPPRTARSILRRVSVLVAGAGIPVALHFGYPILAVLAGFLLLQNLFEAPAGV